MYECEVNTGLYRKYTDDQHKACSNGTADGAAVILSDGTAYTCIVGAWGGNDENKWQLHNMPIKASYADAWYRACANDLFPGGDGCDGDMFACAGSYHVQLAADLENEKNTGLETWAIALIVVIPSLLCAPPDQPAHRPDSPPARCPRLLRCPADYSRDLHCLDSPSPPH